MSRVLLLRACGIALLTALVPAIALAAEPAHHHDALDYDHQENWQGVLNHAQSPIDIVTASAQPSDPDEPASIEIADSPAPATVEDTGHGIQVDTETADATIRGRHFHLTQFHFHSPSEHTIDGKHYPLEGHFVFRARDGRIAVIGVMYDDGDTDNPTMEAVLSQLDHDDGAAKGVIEIDPLIPDGKSYFHYLGSLTTPPLTENVEWYVFSTPVTLSKKEMEALHGRYPRNNRDIQPMNERPLIFHAED